jgi:hypothetical protein
MRIDDDGQKYVDFYLLGVNQLVEQVPWAYILNGQVSSWKSFRLEANLAWQRVATLAVDVTQEITFRLGASGNVLLGGPTDFPLEVTRVPLVSSGHGFARIKVNGIWRQAIPYVKDNGEWKQAEPWGRKAGEWKPAPK